MWICYSHQVFHLFAHFTHVLSKQIHLCFKQFHNYVCMYQILVMHISLCAKYVQPSNYFVHKLRTYTIWIMLYDMVG